MSHSLHLRLPDGLWKALQEHCAHSDESVNHAVASAIADALDIEHHTIYQVSTSGALVEGVFKGCVRVGDIRRHGDFGLGSFDGLDGEGIMLDGVCWQAKSDGSVQVAPDDALAPFWVATHFAADHTQTVTDISDLETLTRLLDSLRSSENIFAAIRVRGRFNHVKYRVACKCDAGVTLLEASKHQQEFVFDDIEGTLVGFWTPEYARTINVPGYHLHFISDDFRHAGHVLALRAQALELELHVETNLQLVLPETPEFLAADLTGDPAAALAASEDDTP